MSNLKNTKNRKLINLKFLWCLIAFLVAFPAIFVAQCSDGTQKCTITLPSLQNGIEKIEYTLNGEAQGSVDGRKTIEAEPGSKLNFAIKFESKGYSQNRVRNVEIISETNKSLKLNTYSYDEIEGFLLMKVPDDELINPDQIYISSDYTVKSDDILTITGIESNKYTAKIRSENTDINLKEAIDLMYTTDGTQYFPVTFSEENNSYIISDLTCESDVKLNIIQKTGYDDSSVSLYCNDSEIVLNQSLKTCSLPNLTDDLEIIIKNLKKNSYTVSSPENARFKFKIKDQSDYFNYQSSVIAQYGDTIEFTCDEKYDETTGEITANGIAIAGSNGVYTIENINQNYDICITPKDSVLYPITLTKAETRVAMADVSGTKSEILYASYDSGLDFKIIPNEEYQKNFIASQVYAIPTEKLLNGTYDFETNSEEAKSFLVVPSADKVYSLTNITEPITLIVDNLIPSICSVFLPQSVIGANVLVVSDDNVEQISENQFDIPYGSDFMVEITAKNGYDISDLNVCDFDNALEIEKTGNRYKFKNIINDSYLIINGAKKSSCAVTFSDAGITATNLSGDAWPNNTTAITHETGELKFKVKPAENCTISDSGLSLSIKSGSGQLTKATDETNEYILTNVTEDIVLEADGIICPDVKITFVQPNDDIIFTSIDEESKALPEETVVPYGTDLNFRMVSASGRSVDNLELASSDGSEIVQNDTISDAYSVFATSDLMVYSSENTSISATGSNGNIRINLTGSQSDVSDLESDNEPTTGTRKVEFSGEGTVIETDIMIGDDVGGITTTNTVTVNEGSGLIFYSSPRMGYQFQDELTIQNALDVNSSSADTFNFKLLNTMETTGGEDGSPSTSITTSNKWFYLENTGLYLRWRLNDTVDKIIYEIADGQTEIDEYYKYDKQSQTWESTIPQNTISRQYGGINKSIKINSKRDTITYKINFEYTDGINYVSKSTSTITDNVAIVKHGESYAFDVEALDGYDVSNIQVLSTVPGDTSIIPYMNNLYILTNITENITISVTNVEKTCIPLVFNQYDGVSYKNISGDYYVYRQDIPYNTEIAFQIEIAPRYLLSSNAIKVGVRLGGGNEIEFVDSSENISENKVPYKKGNLYVIPAELVNDQITVSIISGLKINSYEIKLNATKTDKQKFSYYDQYGKEPLPFADESDQTNKNLVNYGDSFSFQIKANGDSYDLSSIQVIVSDGTRTEALVPADGVYTIADVTTDYTVTVSGISKVTHTVEFRTVDGVTCLDQYGDSMDKKLTVIDGDSVTFYLSFDTAYNQSKNNADLVQVKGYGSLSPDKTDGKYVLPAVTSDMIVEIINVTKNTYTATFVPTEGVVYKTAKGKEFEGALQVEYGETLYFKISLLDAYDQSFPNVKMNETENLVENSGSYCLENISDDIRVTVENVEKNPEEVTIDSIMKVPENVVSESDVDAVIAATNAYNSLTDEEKELVRNKHELESAQRNSGDINHTYGDITITGVDWNIKLVVKNFSNDSEQIDSMQSEVDRRELISLYDIDLIDTLTGEEYEIPYGSSAQITMPTPDLTGYKNIVVVHKNDVDNIEYIDVNIVDDTAKLEISSTGLFGIAAKKIPNYSEDVSDVSISVSSLIESEDELKTLLGENLSSELGHLIDLNEINGSSENSQSMGNTNSSEMTDKTLADSENSLSSSLSSAVNSIGEDIMGSAESIYNWAIDNEFWAVIIILIVGSALIGIIIVSNRKKEESGEK